VARYEVSRDGEEDRVRSDQVADGGRQEKEEDLDKLIKPFKMSGRSVRAETRSRAQPCKR